MSSANARSGRCLTLAAAITTTWMILLTPGRASAQFYVRQPDVEKGETEFEEHGAVYTGPGENEDLRQSHEVEFKHGFSERAQLIVEGFFEQPIGDDLQATEFEIGSQYELIKPPGDDGFAFAFRALYEGLRDEPNEILFGPLARFRKGRDSTTLNTFFIGQVGGDPTIDGLEFQYNWQLKHELNRRVAFGVEAFGEIEDLSNAGSFHDQLHRVGPVIYLNWGQEAEEEFETEREQESEAPEWKLAGGILFGLSHITSDVTFKFDAEFEF
jgi:hypothetical protein